MPNRHNVHVTRSSGRTGMIAVSVVVLGAVLAGCTPVGVAVGAGAAGVTATQKEKGFSQSVDDTRIRAQLNADFIANNVDLFSQISFTVEEGRVLLAGNVPTPEARVEAVKLTWGVPGVTEVINEITVTDKSSLSDDSRDLWIATKLRGRLLVDDQISSINYSIDVVNKTVYVMGVARSTTELNRVLGHARQVSHVRRVVDHTRLIQATPAS
jgi:osmotically-inducible protein OsmY